MPARNFDDKLGRRTERCVADELSQQVFLQAHPGRGCARLVNAVHSHGNIPDLNGRHALL
jgi:hypothetical protein